MPHLQKRSAQPPHLIGGADIEMRQCRVFGPETSAGANHAALLAVDGGRLMLKSSTLPSPALTLQGWLETDLLGPRDENVVLDGSDESTERWPRIYGLLIALAFSLLAWFAIAKLVLHFLGR